MRRSIVTAAACLAGLVGATGVAFAAGGAGAAGSSRLDDGKDLLPQAKVTEQQAITAAQDAASGALNEVDLERYQGKLVFNVDVGRHDVKVDASDGTVLGTPIDDDTGVDGA